MSLFFFLCNAAMFSGFLVSDLIVLIGLSYATNFRYIEKKKRWTEEHEREEDRETAERKIREEDDRTQHTREERRKAMDIGIWKYVVFFLKLLSSLWCTGIHAIYS